MIDSIQSFHSLIWQSGDVRELRVLTADKWKTQFGYFDDPTTMASLAAHLSEQGDVRGVYFTLNPTNPALRARSANNVKRADKGGGTKGAAVSSSCWTLTPHGRLAFRPPMPSETRL